MAKYRGKHNGNPRGHYRQKTLTYFPKDIKELNKQSSAVSHYLQKQGIQGVESGYRAPHGDWQELEKAGYESAMVIEDHVSYHLGGATLDFYARGFNRPGRYAGRKVAVHTARMQIHIVSNESLDDVVERIRNKFSFFKELKERID